MFNGLRSDIKCVFVQPMQKLKYNAFLDNFFIFDLGNREGPAFLLFLATSPAASVSLQTPVIYLGHAHRHCREILGGQNTMVANKILSKKYCYNFLVR